LCAGPLQVQTCFAIGRIQGAGDKRYNDETLRSGCARAGRSAFAGRAQYVSDAEPFITAVRARDGDKATELINSRPTIVNTATQGRDALNIAIARSDDLWTKFLIGKGARREPRRLERRHALITAARVGYTDAIDLLLQLGSRSMQPTGWARLP
jgi:hypothetical protein